MGTGRACRAARAAAILGSLALAIASVPSAQASVNRTVGCHGSGGGVKGLRAAVEAANKHGGGQITLAKGCTYTFTHGRYRDQSGGNALPIITSPIEIMGNQSTLTRKSRDRFRFFEVSAEGGSDLELHGMTLSRGRTATSEQETHNGGAILTMGRLVLHQTTLKRNSSANGGAIEADGGRVHITKSTFVRNHARDVPGATAGAIGVDRARVTIRRTTLARNDAYAKGGAIAIFSGALRISDSTLTGNTVSINGAGGGIFNYGRLTIDRTTLSDNEANGYGGNGGAIANYAQGRLVLTKSEITGNTAGTKGRDVSRAFGGGIASFGAAELTKVDITGNRAQGGKARGGGIAVKAGQLSIAKSTVSGNSPNNCSGQIQGRC